MNTTDAKPTTPRGDRDVFPIEIVLPDGTSFRGRPDHFPPMPTKTNLVQRAREQRLGSWQNEGVVPLTPDECTELAGLRTFLARFPSSFEVLRATPEERERLERFYEDCEPPKRLVDYAAHVAALAQSFLSATARLRTKKETA
jgi:hypothetical protein